MTYIIAEAGTCHRGDLFKAMTYIEAAYKAGADAIKFQVFDAPTESSMFCWIPGDEDRASRWWRSAMPYDQWEECADWAEALGIELIFSCFENTTVHWQNILGLKKIKVASRAAATYPYDIVGGKEIIVSDGMLGEGALPNHVVRMQCCSEYPSYRLWDGVYPGFSDHSGAPITAIQAIGRGVPFLEVHFYLDPKDAGPDYPHSLTLEQLAFVCDARDDAP